MVFRIGASVEVLAGGDPSAGSEPAMEAKATTAEEESVLARRHLGAYL